MPIPFPVPDVISPLVSGVVDRLSRRYVVSHAAKGALEGTPGWSNLTEAQRHRAQERLLRCLGPFIRHATHKGNLFSPFCPMAIRGVGGQPAIEDRRLTIPLMVPPRPSHLHLFMFRVAYLLSALGARVTMVLEDVQYLRNARNKKAVGWIVPTAAVARFRDAWRTAHAALDEAEASRIGREEVRIVTQSQLVGSLVGIPQERLDSAVKAVVADDSLQESLGSLKVLRANKSVTLLDVNLLVESYITSVVYTKPDFLLVGSDRRAFYELLATSLSPLPMMPTPPTTLVWEDVPALDGSVEWAIDDRRLLYVFDDPDLRRAADGASGAFRRWLKRNLSTIELAKVYSAPKEAPTVRQLAEEIVSETGGNVVSVVGFGRSMCEHQQGGEEGANRVLSPLLLTWDTPPKFEGDVDLVFVVRKKDVASHTYLTEKLARHGMVVHHPDFYSRRTPYERVFEIIVLPQGSQYFSPKKLGYLTGSSVFAKNRYVHLAGAPIETVLTLPANAEPEGPKERLDAYKRCHWGLNDLRARLWPYLGAPYPPFDVRRLARVMVMDGLWVLSGEWLYDRSSLLHGVERLLSSEDGLCHFLRACLSRSSSEELEPYASQRLYRLLDVFESAAENAAKLRAKRR